MRSSLRDPPLSHMMGFDSMEPLWAVDVHNRDLCLFDAHLGDEESSASGHSFRRKSIPDKGNQAEVPPQVRVRRVLPARARTLSATHCSLSLLQCLVSCRQQMSHRTVRRKSLLRISFKEATVQEMSESSSGSESNSQKWWGDPSSPL